MSSTVNRHRGLPPYARSDGGLNHPGADLAATTEAMPLPRQNLPDFYNAFRNFPRAVPLQHRFFWEKKTVRPADALAASRDGSDHARWCDHRQS